MYITEATAVFLEESVIVDVIYTPKMVPKNKEMTERWDSQVERALSFPPADSILKMEETIWE